MKVKHIIFDANVLVKFPDTYEFLHSARKSASGMTNYIRCHCVPRTDIGYILEQLRNKEIEIIVISKACAEEVMDSLGLPYDRIISDINHSGLKPDEYHHVRYSAKSKANASHILSLIESDGKSIC